MPLIGIARGLLEDKKAKKRRTKGRRFRGGSVREAPREELEEREEKTSAISEEKTKEAEEKPKSIMNREEPLKKEEEEKEGEIAEPKKVDIYKSERKKRGKLSFEDILRAMDRDFWNKFLEVHKFWDSTLAIVRKMGLVWDFCYDCEVGVYDDRIVMNDRYGGKFVVYTDKPLETLREILKRRIAEEDFKLEGLYIVAKNSKLKRMIKKLLSDISAPNFSLKVKNGKVIFRGIDDSRAMFVELVVPVDFFDKKYIKYFEVESSFEQHIKPDLFETSWRVKINSDLYGLLKKTASLFADVIFDPKSKRISVRSPNYELIIPASFEGGGMRTAVASEYLKKSLDLLAGGKNISFGSNDSMVAIVEGSVNGIEAKFLIEARTFTDEELAVEVPSRNLRKIGIIEYHAKVGSALFYRNVAFLGGDITRDYRNAKGIFFGKSKFTEDPLLIDLSTNFSNGDIGVKGVAGLSDKNLIVDGVLFSGKYSVRGILRTERFELIKEKEVVGDILREIKRMEEELKTQEVVGEIDPKILTGTTRQLDVEDGKIISEHGSRKKELGEVRFKDARFLIIETLEQTAIKELIGEKKLPPKIPIIRTKSGSFLAKIDGEKGTLYLRVDIYR